MRERWPDWNLGLMRMTSPPELVARAIDGYRKIGWDLRDDEGPNNRVTSTTFGS